MTSYLSLSTFIVFALQTDAFRSTIGAAFLSCIDDSCHGSWVRIYSSYKNPSKSIPLRNLRVPNIAGMVKYFNYTCCGDLGVGSFKFLFFQVVSHQV